MYVSTYSQLHLFIHVCVQSYLHMCIYLCVSMAASVAGSGNGFRVNTLTIICICIYVRTITYICRMYNRICACVCVSNS